VLDSLELLLMGIAVVVDSVLLLIVFEKNNRAKTGLWLKFLTIGVWLFHACNFYHLLIRRTDGDFWMQLDRVCFTWLSLGFLVLPSAMLHAACRLTTNGVDPKPNWDSRYLWLYLPMMAWPWSWWLIWQQEGRDFFQAVRPMIVAYLGWLLIANSASAMLFWRLRNRLKLPGSSNFFTQIALILIALSGLSIAYIFSLDRPVMEVVLRLVTVLLPVVPAVMFVWSILRQRMMPLMVERSFVYFGILGIVVLIHRLFVAPLTSLASQQTKLDFVLLEWILLFGLVMLVRPLRDRLRAGLRSLFSYDPYQVLDATRRLSVDLARQSEPSIEALADWFAQATRRELDLEFVKLEIHSPIEYSTSFMEQAAERSLTIDESWVIPLSYRAIGGQLVLGPRLRRDRLEEDQRTAFGLLGDQLAATLNNRWLELERLTRERKSMEQEKLSMLGLMASSMAHEIRNPLSSIRTIATLLQEELVDKPTQREEISLMIGEIDRLTKSTHRLTDFAKPSDGLESQTPVEPIMERILHLLKTFAQQQQVSLKCEFSLKNLKINGSEAAISEIVFNLVRNAIEASREVNQGCVEVSGFQEGVFLLLTVRDNGLGISPSIRDRIFQPFVTSKVEGTGLGLYAVAERVRELRGEIRWLEPTNEGTVFEVRLPLAFEGNQGREKPG
jgi:signal transduction histidine kinase